MAISNSRVNSQISRSSCVEHACVCIVLLFYFVLSVALSLSLGPVYDEPAHLSSGLSHWQTGSFDLYCVNPPLVRCVASLPMYLFSNYSVAVDSLRKGFYNRPEFEAGSEMQDHFGRGWLWYLTLGRIACIPLCMCGPLCAYKCARHLYGRRSGLLAVILYCSCPNLLTWGSLITPDAVAASFCCATVYLFLLWWEEPTWALTLLLGIVFGFLQTTKATFICLYPSFVIAWLLKYTLCHQHMPPDVRRSRFFRWINIPSELTMIFAVFMTSILVLNSLYGFEGCFSRLAEYKFISNSLGGADAHLFPGNRFRDSWAASIPVPLPYNYIRGIDIQKFDFERGDWSYLRGQWKRGGWWYYYIYTFFVKTPSGVLMLFLLALAVTLLKRADPSLWKKEVVLLLPAFAILCLVSSQTGFNRFYRYVLPCMPLVMIFISKLGCLMAPGRSAWSRVCVFCVAWAVVSCMSTVPFTMSYFNEFAGGPLNGWKHVIDASIDWGQDLYELEKWTKRHPRANPLFVAYCGATSPKLLGIDCLSMEESILPHIRGDENCGLRPRKGWYIVSINYLLGAAEQDHGLGGCGFLRGRVPNGFVGYSMYVFKWEPDDAEP